MSKSPTWTTGNTAGRDGWCINAAIMMAASAWHWMMGMDVSVYRAFPVPKGRPNARGKDTTILRI